MNGEDEQQGPTLGDFDPSWMNDGGGVQGEQSDPDFSSQTQWQAATAYSGDHPSEDFYAAPRRRRIPPSPLSRINWNTHVQTKQNQALEDFIGGI